MAESNGDHKAGVQPSQVFYALNLVNSSAPTAAVTCNVVPGLKQQDQQILEARGERLYLRRIEENDDRTESFITTVFEQDIFCIVRGLAAFRIPGAATDHIVISADSGRMGMYEYDAEQNRLKQVHLESFGKSGIRRTIPGQYLASDPRGRCLMLASTEKNKVVYIYQRTPEGSINISSPHEANSWTTLTFDICPLDVGWEHPIFASLEVDYADIEQAPSSADPTAGREKVLSYYTVDLGLNHVVKTWSDSVDWTANKVFGIPGGSDGPSGVIVCAKGRLYYKHERYPSLSIQIPRRKGPLEDPNRESIVVSGCLFLHRGRHEFFYLLQTDAGDVFKLTMNCEDDFTPKYLVLKYFDTFPVATKMLLIRKGYIYVASENGTSKLYHVDDLGEDPEFEPEKTFTSNDADGESLSADPEEALAPVYFTHRKLTLVSEMATIPALHPLLKSKVDNIMGEDAPQIMGICGSGNTSSFKLIRHGNSVTQDASISQGSVPFDCVWSLKAHIEAPYTRYLVVTSRYADRTMILGVDGEDINGLDDTEFVTNRATIFAALMGTTTLVQVHARGVHSILEDGQVNEWPAPAHRSIVCAASNARQLLCGLSSGELAFFFMDASGILSALEEQPEMSGKVTAIGVAHTPTGKLQAKYGVVGCDDMTVRVLSIALETPLELRSIQAVSDVPTSIVVIDMLDPDSGTDATVVHIGLQSGIYLRAIIDDYTGELSQVRSKFLGARPVRIFPVEVQGQQCIIACSSKPWIGYHHPVTKQYTMVPLITPWLEAVSPFFSTIASGLCGVANTELRFFRPDQLGQRLVTEEISLQYTPRAFAKHSATPIIYVVESEANTMPQAIRQNMLESNKDSSYEEGAVLSNPRAPGHWASCVQALDPVTSKAVTSTIYLDDNEAALCCAVIGFEVNDFEPLLVVGTGRDLNNGDAVKGGNRGGGFIRVYKLLDEGKTLQFLHKTEFQYPIYALIPFKGRMAVGVANELLIYDLGTKHVLRKSRNVVVPNTIVCLEQWGNRIICGDVSESITFVVYKEEFNRLIPFVDDTISRWTTCAGMVDYDTVAGGDKFGNLWILRCPDNISREADDEGMNGYIMNERPYMGGTPYRLELRAHYFTQDIPMSVQRTALLAGGQEVLFWSGIQGTMGMLVPFLSLADVKLFTELELQMRQADPPLVGRDHLAFRSYYAPTKAVIDGELCERFLQLSYNKKQEVAAECERPVAELEKKIQEMRTRVAF